MGMSRQWVGRQKNLLHCNMLLATVAATFLVAVDAGIFGKAKRRAAEAAAAAAAKHEALRESKIFMVCVGIFSAIVMVVGLMGMMSKSSKQKRIVGKEKDSQQQEEVAKKIEEHNKKSDKKIEVTVSVIDVVSMEKSKSKAVNAKRNNGKGGAPRMYVDDSVPQKKRVLKNERPTGTVKGPSELSATKIGVVGNKDYMALFESTNGSEATAVVKLLTKRHSMVNPGMHPAEPYMECFEETWLPLQESRDPEGEQLVKALAEELTKKGIKFEDPTFPADYTSLFADPTTAGANAEAEQSFRKDQDPFLAGVEGIEWKRPHEWGNLNETVCVWSGGVDPDDVAQGRLGNCYYLAAMAGCALGDNDILIKDLCIEDFGNVGLYAVKFFINGKWATVVIDDRIPCIPWGSGWNPIFAGPKAHSGQKEGEKEIWPMIFEKAWAKLHLSYEATAGGLTQDAASYLSGGVIKTEALERGSDNDEAWRSCVKSLNPADGNSFAFLSCAVRAEEDPSELGLITGHAYSILKMTMTQDGKKFVQIRNPWGEHEWNGRFSDKSSLWTEALKIEVGFEDEDDGSFFMLWEDFVMWFEGIEICDPTFLSNYTEGDMCRVDGFASHWVAGKTAGGDSNCETFKFNPTVDVTVKKDCPVVVTLFQPDVRPMFHPDADDLENKLASVFVCGGDRAKPEKVMQSMGWERQKSVEVNMCAGQTYQVTAATFAPGMQGAFWLILSGYGLEMKAVPFVQPTAEQADVMEENLDPYGCCANCHNELGGAFYNTSAGPNCEGCATGSPPPKKMRSSPAEPRVAVAVTEEEGKTGCTIC
mmetsp:Transcript_27927/g.44895  ORF Transcript_27927/g.44895 Transcript_27927/m.44895 type:complete len:816 (+) Transcript_27927:47-2494(+)